MIEDNPVQIELEKEIFIGGDDLEGCVIFTANKHEKIHSMRVQVAALRYVLLNEKRLVGEDYTSGANFSGKEKIYKAKKHSSSKVLYDHSHTIFNDNRYFDVGTHKIPFKVPLPKGTPPSIDADLGDQDCAQVRYGVSVFLAKGKHGLLSRHEIKAASPFEYRPLEPMDIKSEIRDRMSIFSFSDNLLIEGYQGNPSNSVGANNSYYDPEMSLKFTFVYPHDLYPNDAYFILKVERESHKITPLTLSRVEIFIQSGVHATEGSHENKTKITQEVKMADLHPMITTNQNQLDTGDLLFGLKSETNIAPSFKISHIVNFHKIILRITVHESCPEGRKVCLATAKMPVSLLSERLLPPCKGECNNEYDKPPLDKDYLEAPCMLFQNKSSELVKSSYYDDDYLQTPFTQTFHETSFDQIDVSNGSSLSSTASPAYPAGTSIPPPGPPPGAPPSVYPDDKKQPYAPPPSFPSTTQNGYPEDEKQPYGGYVPPPSIPPTTPSGYPNEKKTPYGGYVPPPSIPPTTPSGYPDEKKNPYGSYESPPSVPSITSSEYPDEKKAPYGGYVPLQSVPSTTPNGYIDEKTSPYGSYASPPSVPSITSNGYPDEKKNPYYGNSNPGQSSLFPTGEAPTYNHSSVSISSSSSYRDEKPKLVPRKPAPGPYQPTQLNKTPAKLPPPPLPPRTPSPQPPAKPFQSYQSQATPANLPPPPSPPRSPSPQPLANPFQNFQSQAYPPQPYQPQAYPPQPYQPQASSSQSYQSQAYPPQPYQAHSPQPSMSEVYPPQPYQYQGKN